MWIKYDLVCFDDKRHLGLINLANISRFDIMNHPAVDDEPETFILIAYMNNKETLYIYRASTNIMAEQVMDAFFHCMYGRDSEGEFGTITAAVWH